MTVPGARKPPATSPPPTGDGAGSRIGSVAGTVAGAASAVMAFTVGLGLVWLRQERIVWQPPRVRDADRATPEGAERVEYGADDGQPLFGYVVRPAADVRAGILLAFHGNAELAAWSVPWAREVARRTGHAVLLPEYRGYAGLPGAPDYPCSRLDARAAYRAALAHLGAAPAEIALYGHSLGTALATELADALVAEGAAPRALLLESPFTSAKAMARVVLSEGVERWWRRISRIHFDTEARVAGLDVPVSVAHGRLDLVVPVRMGRQVHARARVPGELLVVPHAGHNDVVESAGEEYWGWLERALTARAG